MTPRQPAWSPEGSPGRLTIFAYYCVFFACIAFTCSNNWLIRVWIFWTCWAFVVPKVEDEAVEETNEEYAA